MVAVEVFLNITGNIDELSVREKNALCITRQAYTDLNTLGYFKFES